MLLAAISVPGLGLAAEPDPRQLQAMVQDSVDQYVKAYTERNVPGLMALFTPEAEFINSDGVIFHGKGAIEAEFAASFQVTPPGTLEIELLSIRPVAAGIVTEDGLTRFIGSNGEKMGSTTRYTALHVLQPDGSWLLASVRELQQEQPSPHQQLLQLSWLLGRWHEDVNGVTIETRWDWSADGQYLISEFQVTGLPGGPLKGTHRIGWNAERRQFRSWVFDADGSVSEGWWQPVSEDTWSVTLQGVDDQGTRRSSVLRYTQTNQNVLVVEQAETVRGGVSLPGSSHRIVRQSPEPQPSISGKR